MPRRQTDLFDQIASFAALHRAAQAAVRGKRSKPGAAAFLARLEPALLALERQLRDGTYAPGAHVQFVVRDPKRREVSAAPFRDRVVHHALHAAIGPIFERGFIADTFANRVGMGTHKALARYEHFRDRHAWVLRTDIWQYFPSIDHTVLKTDLRRRIGCVRTLALCDRLIDGHAPLHLPGARPIFPGDDLFTPLERPCGLPLGNLTSQFFANVYLDALDHYCKEVLRAPYVRYVDDIALFGTTPEQLTQWQLRIAAHLAHRRLLLHPRKTGIAPTAQPARFLGFITAPGGRRQLDPANVNRFVHRLNGLRMDFQARRLNRQDVQCRVQAWVAHAHHAQTARLRHTLFAGGWFDPFWADGSPVEARAP